MPGPADSAKPARTSACRLANPADESNAGHTEYEAGFQTLYYRDSRLAVGSAAR